MSMVEKMRTAMAKAMVGQPGVLITNDALDLGARAAIEAMGPVMPITEWFKRHSDYKNPEAFIRTNASYFAAECAAAIQAALRDA
jgi:hypothetical protein